MQPSLLEGESGTPLRVLVVDGYPDTAWSMAMALRHLGEDARHADCIKEVKARGRAGTRNQLTPVPLCGMGRLGGFSYAQEVWDSQPTFLHVPQNARTVPIDGFPSP